MWLQSALLFPPVLQFTFSTDLADCFFFFLQQVDGESAPQPGYSWMWVTPRSQTLCLLSIYIHTQTEAREIQLVPVFRGQSLLFSPRFPLTCSSWTQIRLFRTVHSEIKVSFLSSFMLLLISTPVRLYLFLVYHFYMARCICVCAVTINVFICFSFNISPSLKSINMFQHDNVTKHKAKFHEDMVWKNLRALTSTCTLSFLNLQQCLTSLHPPVAE